MWIYCGKLIISFLVKIVSEEFSSSGDSKTEEDPEKRSVKDKEGKDRERDREEGEYQWVTTVVGWYAFGYEILGE